MHFSSEVVKIQSFHSHKNTLYRQIVTTYFQLFCYWGIEIYSGVSISEYKWLKKLLLDFTISLKGDILSFQYVINIIVRYFIIVCPLCLTLSWMYNVPSVLRILRCHFGVTRFLRLDRHVWLVWLTANKAAVIEILKYIWNALDHVGIVAALAETSGDKVKEQGEVKEVLWFGHFVFRQYWTLLWIFSLAW